jgi:hypothetical protein
MTAVEQLEKEIYQWLDGRVYIPTSFFEQAKAMEKDQIIIAFDMGSQDENRIGKEYYNDLYAD